MLSDLEKGKIIAFNEANLSKREIGRRLGRSDHVIRNLLENTSKYNTKRRKPKKSKHSDRN